MKIHNTHTTILGVSAIFIGLLFGLRLYDTAAVTREIPDIKVALPKLTNKITSSNSPVEFIDETFIRGITHRHTQKKDKISSFEDSLGGGVCVADFNNDNWDDLFFITGSGNRRHFGKENWWQEPQPNQLYINQSGMYFRNETIDSGIKEVGFGIACAAADLNNDGNIDIIVANKGENYIYENKGNGKFNRVTSAFDKNNNYFSTSILIFDANKDGLDDILFGNYVAFEQEQNVLELNAGYETQKNINFEAALYDAQPDTLFINQGNFLFAHNEALLAPNKHGRTLSFIEDGTILALNDKGSPSEKIFTDPHSNKIGSITVNARDAKIITPPSETGEELLLASDASKGGVYALTLDGEANDKSWDYGINHETRLNNTTWAILKGDFNIDGLDDIFLSNGSSMPHPDANKTTTGQGNILLVADKTLINFTQKNLKNERILSSRGAATLDMNNDGKLDIIVNNNNDYPSLLINKTESNNSWIGLRCSPSYLCNNSKVSLDKNLLGKVFKRTTNYASQSSGSHISVITEKSSHIITIENDDFNVEFTLDDTNHYYSINLQEKTIKKLDVEKHLVKPASISDREEFISLLRKNIITHRYRELLNQLSSSDKNDRLIILNEIHETQNRNGFPLADRWASDNDMDVSLKAIKLLEELEKEESIPTLINLIEANNPTISCTALKAFQHFYWKDEAAPERKHWAESTIIKILSSGKPENIECAIDAIAESESYRALKPLLQLLTSENHILAARAARALGMIRQTEAIPALKYELTNSISPFVRAEVLISLSRLNQDLEKIETSHIFKKDNELFNEALIFALKKSTDLTAHQDIKNFTSNKNSAYASIFNTLNYNELVSAYTLLTEPNTGKIDNYDNKLSNRLHITKMLLAKFSDSISIRSIYPSLSASEKYEIRESATEAVKGLLHEMDMEYAIKNCELKNHEGISINHCKHHLTDTEISNTIRSFINSGRYSETIIYAFQSQESIYYSSAINTLLDDKRIQKSELIFTLNNLPLKTDNLEKIASILKSWTAEEQLSTLRSIKKQIPDNIFSNWVSNYTKQISNNAINFYAQGLEKVAPTNGVIHE